MKQLTISELVTRLQAFPEDVVVALDKDNCSVHNPHSYRGYYEHLALAPTTDTKTVAEVVDMLTAAWGSVFYGWKGGEFLMDADTPVWISQTGDADSMMVVDVTYDEDHNEAVLMTMIEE